MGYQDRDRRARAQLAYYHRYRKTWLAKQKCRRCGRRGPPLRVLRKAGTPKLNWGPDGPHGVVHTVLCPDCLAKGRREVAEGQRAERRELANRQRRAKRAALKRSRTMALRRAGLEPAPKVPKPAPVIWEDPAPDARLVVAVARAAERKPAPRRHRIELTADEKRMVAENGRIMADVPPCPVHQRGRAVRAGRGQLAYRCCGRPVVALFPDEEAKVGLA